MLIQRFVLFILILLFSDVLAADPDITAEDAAAFVQERQQFHPRDQQALMLPDGTMVSLQGGGRTFSIRSRATLDTDTWREVQATIELGGDHRGRPFRVLSWRDNVEDR